MEMDEVRDIIATMTDEECKIILALLGHQADEAPS